ncbi:DegT/DnrJ/EryC1/StrS family aminotransferase [Allopusillimonas ginsengisoli]|nr:DegT/DnrJ/EryC1/StrS family aminotransferase [Allopusillimonas ginsengisoli]
MQFIDLKKQYEVLRAPINARVQAVLDHGQYIMGPEVKELETALAKYVGAKHCITVASGTEALLMSLMALGVQAGDEIITTSFTFIATAEVIVLLGAKPVFVDVLPDTCNIDASKIEAKITDRTRAIIPVSLYGQCGDMDEVNSIAARRGLAVIEDGAQSFGASYKGERSCNLSTLGCTSFFPSKPLGCYGDGGAVFTNDDTLAQALREIRVHGQSKRYYHTRVGVGGRMDTLQCAVVLGKLERFEWEVEQRIRIGNRYLAHLEDVRDVQTVTVRDDRTSVWAQFTIMVPNRESIIEKLKAAGVPTAIHYPRPIHQQPAYARYAAEGETPVSEWLAGRVLSLPMHPDLDDQMQDEVIKALRAALG